MPARILYVDAYDSFSNNVISFLETKTGTRVTSIKIDARISDLPLFLKNFAAVVLGPGPGHPCKPEDVGLYKQIWKLADDHILPVLGVCLGFQSLILEHGGKVERLVHPRHGLQTNICTSSSFIFEGIKFLDVVQYHSLHAITHDFSWSKQEETFRWWEPSATCPDLLPLAWDLGDSERGYGLQSNDGPILMAVKHMRRPFYGIQFHPESAISSVQCLDIITRWWSCVLEWQSEHNPSHDTSSPGIMLPTSTDVERSSMNSTESGSPVVFTPSTCSSPESESSPTSPIPSEASRFVTKTLQAQSLSVPVICSVLGLGKDELIVLDSELRQGDSLGQSSIIGLIEPDTPKLKYHVGSNRIVREQDGHSAPIDLSPYSGNVFTFLQAYMALHSHSDPQDILQPPIFPQSTTFCGGLMGYLTYEACLETIDIHSTPLPERPDICFAFVERSIVIDHARHLVYIQSIHPDDQGGTTNWVQTTATKLHTVATLCAVANPREATTLDVATDPPLSLHSNPEALRSTIPTERSYKNKIGSALESIAAGDSYELCLTDQTTVTLPPSSPWRRYLSMRRLNPAAFAAYVRLGSLTLLSTSPERFLAWSRAEVSAVRDGAVHCKEGGLSEAQHRPAGLDGTGPDAGEHDGADLNAASQAAEPAAEPTAELVTTATFHPIKGTVAKFPAGRRPVSRSEAEELLRSPKERAENLMIVDLIRHDAHGVAGSGNVDVTAYLRVMECETLWQLYSTVEAKLRRPLGGAGRLAVERRGRDLGVDLGVDLGIDLGIDLRRDGGKDRRRDIGGRRGEGDGAADTHSPATDTHSPAPAPAYPSGLALLGASLPPGSMTGAPKRRSCAILRKLEAGRRRGVYSGVVGYVCVSGRGDFSVVIRSAYRWDDEGGGCSSGGGGGGGEADTKSGDGDGDGQLAETWHIGAGGAITGLSSAQGEWDEMLAKLKGTLGAFAPGAEQGVGH